MRFNRKHILLFVAGLLLVIALIRVYLDYTVPPKAWSQIHIGDTAAQVRAKCPDVIQDLHNVKGDFCFRKMFMACWCLHISYGPDDKVSSKYCLLRAGVPDNFKDFRLVIEDKPLTSTNPPID